MSEAFQQSGQREGRLYPAIVLDVFSRRIVGWSTSKRIDAQLVCAALCKAPCSPVREGELIFHSDRGSILQQRVS